MPLLLRLNSRTRAGSKNDCTSRTTHKIRGDSANGIAPGSSSDCYPEVYSGSNADYQLILFIVQVGAVMLIPMTFPKAIQSLLFFSPFFRKVECHLKNITKIRKLRKQCFLSLYLRNAELNIVEKIYRKNILLRQLINMQFKNIL